MATSTAVAAATLTGSLTLPPRLRCQRDSRAHPCRRTFSRSTGLTSCHLQSWSSSQLRGRKGYQGKHPDGTTLRSSFKGEAVRTAPEGSRPVTHQKTLIEAILPSVLVLPNLAQTAPSFLARLVGFYVLMRAGIAVPYKREVTEEEQETKTLRATKQWKIVNNYNGVPCILRRKWRCASREDGRKRLRMICDVLSEDDTFQMSDTHKGCQIRRESAHSETVSCNGVNALYDDNPFPRMKIDIARFPEGRVGMEEYYKAEKLERVLHSKAR
ncbi:hypothetical protein KFL_002490110 [Klebsormidium nitens]|uniref:Uncharacterized protein n=1 Tax=Klebsormidium nitens TaxID=105231 RepID=A0A1Y1I5B9_KLENI|nr:hypothetical protein KFL_002490110 [Klebsormidium nitens]|eukprot:GAQ85693.1 hypothetical protein KFL_002490110 [Klebsormidium nitens]